MLNPEERLSSSAKIQLKVHIKLSQQLQPLLTPLNSPAVLPLLASIQRNKPQMIEGSNIIKGIEESYFSAEMGQLLQMPGTHTYF